MNGNYQELLLKHEWLLKRKEILKRDHYVCKDCLHGETNKLKFDNDITVLFQINRTKFFSSDDVWDEPVWPLSFFLKANKIDQLEIKGYKGIPGYVFTFHTGLVILSTLPRNRSLNDIKKRDYRIVRLRNKYDSLYFLFHKSQDPCEVLDKKYLPALDIYTLYNAKEREIREYRSWLHVHHKFYVIGNDPWEYSNQALVTLCDACHQRRHEREDIPVYGLDCGGHKIFPDFTVCDRCVGEGYIEEWRHRDEGVCYKCWGTGYLDKRSAIPFVGFNNFIKQFDFKSLGRGSRLSSDYKKGVRDIKVYRADLGNGEGELLYALISQSSILAGNAFIRLDQSCHLEPGDYISIDSARAYLRKHPTDSDYFIITLSGDKQL